MSPPVAAKVVVAPAIPPTTPPVFGREVAIAVAKWVALTLFAMVTAFGGFLARGWHDRVNSELLSQGAQGNTNSVDIGKIEAHIMNHNQISERMMVRLDGIDLRLNNMQEYLTNHTKENSQHIRDLIELVRSERPGGGEK